MALWCFLHDTQRHHTPHFHVEYAEFTAVIDIHSGDVLEGDLPRNKMKLVQAWLEIHREEIAADWSLAVRGLPVQKIKPLE